MPRHHGDRVGPAETTGRNAWVQAAVSSGTCDRRVDSLRNFPGVVNTANPGELRLAGDKGVVRPRVHDLARKHGPGAVDDVGESVLLR